jgi:predicted nucleic acid-binding protein
MENSEAVILDTSALVAAVDRSEQFHAWALNALQHIRPPLITCDAVITESCFLLERLVMAHRQLARWVAEGFIQITESSSTLTRQALNLMDTYSNVPMSYADACLVCMVEARPRSRVFTLDSDFRIYRQRNRRVIPLIAPFV